MRTTFIRKHHTNTSSLTLPRIRNIFVLNIEKRRGIIIAKLDNTANPVLSMGARDPLVGSGKIPLYANQQLQTDKAAEHFKSKSGELTWTLEN